MKLEDVAYAIAGETLSVLEQKYHYRSPDEHKRDIQRTVQANLGSVLTRAAEPPKEAAAEETEAKKD